MKSIFPTLEKYILNLPVLQLSDSREKVLWEIAEAIAEASKTESPIDLVFICTHNSRRSQLGQIWASTFAYYFGLDKEVLAHSGGTEVTAFNTRAQECLKRAGFEIDAPLNENPKCSVVFAADAPPIITFSKLYYDKVNPQTDFLAIMTCNHADKNCPYIPGVRQRLSLPFIDPGYADKRPEEKTAYDHASLEIASTIKMIFIKAQELLKV